MQKLLEALQKVLPQLRFSAGDTFYWSPETQEVFYKSDNHYKTHGDDARTRVQPGMMGEKRSGAHSKVREHRIADQRPGCAECARQTWSLLHETGHALLGHTTYSRDVELLKMEMAAWDKARELAKQFAITIDEEHIQDCLDTYRDWLHARSICPSCTTKCLQRSDQQQYRCHNCHTAWKVTPARFARPYRSVRAVNQLPTIFASEI